MERPSYFLGVKPCCSVCNKSEAEGMALRLVRILACTGDTWRRLSWNEWDLYDDGEEDRFPEWFERKWFDKLADWLTSEMGARTFSPVWGSI